jgi:hypothetical protein
MPGKDINGQTGFTVLTSPLTILKGNGSFIPVFSSHWWQLSHG